MEHGFTPIIREVLSRNHGKKAASIFKQSLLVQYVNFKTRSASKGAKSRSSYANLYVLYVLLEDYLQQGFADSASNYANYEGAIFTDLLKRARELPFGAKLQNHAFNSRLNDEFKKFFPTYDFLPVIRDYETKRYWINENLLITKIGNKTVNIAQAVLEIIDSYIKVKEESFSDFVNLCKKMQKVSRDNPSEITSYVQSLLNPHVDARIFEIVSYSILKQHFANASIFWGWNRKDLTKEQLTLYKTGRTNANDGGIDFVMKPLGRFFQVTETTDVKKYFLDIDKVQRYPITFVIKTNDDIQSLRDEIEKKAKKYYGVKKVVEKYMNCVEEIINIPILLHYLSKTVQQGKIANVFHEIILQSEVEFNFGK